jgi:hypothetical protein
MSLVRVPAGPVESIRHLIYGGRLARIPFCAA